MIGFLGNIFVFHSVLVFSTKIIELQCLSDLAGYLGLELLLIRPRKAFRMSFTVVYWARSVTDRNELFFSSGKVRDIRRTAFEYSRVSSHRFLSLFCKLIYHNYSSWILGWFR